MALSVYTSKQETMAVGLMIHPTAIIDNNFIGKIGLRTKIWAFVHICKGARIGDDVSIGEGCYIGPGVKIGNRCRIQNGAQIFEGVTIGNDVFIGPNVVFTNDKHPSLFHEFKLETTLVKDGASIGANATILPGITIKEHAVIGAGSVVTKSVEINQTVYGNPAR